MKKQGSEIRDQGSEKLERLLRRAMPPVGEQAGLERDLWLAMRQRLDKRVALESVPWFDWALAGGVAVFALAFPAAVPVLLYYL